MITTQKGQKTQLSKHFNSLEFDCSCEAPECTITKISKELVQMLEHVREHFGVPIHINSAFRCKTHNKSVGGAAHSRHIFGDAADIVVAGVPASEVYDFADKLIDQSGGVGRYPTFTHIDVRGFYARWP